MVRRSETKKSKSNESSNYNAENGSEDESCGEEVQLPELMVTSRTPRDGAGAKMQILLQASNVEDDFYKDAYGGAFNEDDQDDVFQSPAHSDEDIVDSDFDKSEEEDDPVSDDDAKGGPRRSKRVKGREENEDRKKKWVIARMGGACVAPNVVDEKKHEMMLKEAEETERINVESLKKYEEFELERKKKREKVTMSKKLIGPRIIEMDSENGKVVIVPSVKNFGDAKKPERIVCAVTGRPARYTDPVTGLPYSSQLAFKVIRDKYYKYLRTVRNREDVSEFLASIE
ncbi:hypothetical protein PMAYCL1PPCAC_23939 [Pristionchus mayeri]|uniref:Vacuolar protein sorting-associated protein 72 homolog n=1 Tax=Pristionchus mayeri TaxID=1317129 RepID=A0AAN5I6Y0_9BILA|nr:hypothetical protein PMAYCL1PPCAC_23939 [Pristionchus mayeri]